MDGAPRIQEPADEQPPALPAPGDRPGDDQPRGRATAPDATIAASMTHADEDHAGRTAPDAPPNTTSPVQLPPPPPDDGNTPRSPSPDASPPQPANQEQHPDNGGDNTAIVTRRREHRLYSPVERAGLKWLAVRDGVSATCQRYGIPLRTLEDWVRADGGLVGIRAWLEERTLADYLRAERAIYEAVVGKAPTLAADDLLLTFRKLAEVRAGLGVAPAGQPATGAVAGAQAEARVTVRLVGDTGEEDVITIDRRGTPAEEDDG